MILWPSSFERSETIGDLEGLLFGKRRKHVVKPDKARGRHVKWEHANNYTLLRLGTRIFENTSAIDALFKEDGIEEEHFYIFRRNELCDRNDTIPLYEALFKTQTAGFVRVQKKHLAMAYRKVGRCRKENMWQVDSENGLPYWVDRYCFSMMGQRDSKKRYEARKKKRKVL